MSKKSLSLLVIITLSRVCFSQGVFFREYWAVHDSVTTNNPEARWRVNDSELSLHEWFGGRWEARPNGLILIQVPEDLFQLKGAALYMEMWGGHPGTVNKQVFVNGRGPYGIPHRGAEAHHCVYSYPEIPLTLSHLVTGNNAFQYACERGDSFWGHFLMDEAAVRCQLKEDHPDLAEAGLDNFAATVIQCDGSVLVQEIETLKLAYTDVFKTKIVSVTYFGRYFGFDDNGNQIEPDWHGYTHDQVYQNVLGKSVTAPYEIQWNTRMIPSQPAPMAVKALVEFENGIQYWTPVLEGLTFAPKRPVVRLYACTDMPVPFWSRDKNEKLAVLPIYDDLSNLENAELWVRVWDGGEGEVKHPFTLNGHPYQIVTGKSIHDVVFTAARVDLSHLKQGENQIRLYSDTHHHGIEMLLPGPCLILRWK